jgi:hypothetical protein
MIMNIIDSIKRLLFIKKSDIIDREQLMELHVDFSKYMLPRLIVMRRNLNNLQRLPMKYNDVGETIGTLELSEWGEILDEIVFALRYDCGQTDNDVIIPSHGEQDHIRSYLRGVKSDYERYRRGCRLLGLYYGDLWG